MEVFFCCPFDALLGVTHANLIYNENQIYQTVDKNYCLHQKNRSKSWGTNIHIVGILDIWFDVEFLRLSYMITISEIFPEIKTIIRLFHASKLERWFDGIYAIKDRQCHIFKVMFRRFGADSISHKAFHRKIIYSLEGVRLGIKMLILLWNLTGCRGACQILKRLENSNQRSRAFKTFFRSYDKTSYAILNHPLDFKFGRRLLCGFWVFFLNLGIIFDVIVSIKYKKITS